MFGRIFGQFRPKSFGRIFGQVARIPNMTKTDFFGRFLDVFLRILSIFWFFKKIKISYYFINNNSTIFNSFKLENILINSAQLSQVLHLKKWGKNGGTLLGWFRLKLGLSRTVIRPNVRPNIRRKWPNIRHSAETNFYCFGRTLDCIPKM